MNNPWLAGQIAKILTSKKRSRKFWNIFFSSIILILFAFAFVFLYRILCDHLVHKEEHIFVDCYDGFLITDIGSYKIADENEQKVNISTLKAVVNNGDKIVLFLSEISGELVEIKYFSSTVYQIKVDQLWPSIFLLLVFFFPLIGLTIFMLIVTNIKNPSKKIYNLQRIFLLR